MRRLASSVAALLLEISTVCSKLAPFISCKEAKIATSEASGSLRKPPARDLSRSLRKRYALKEAKIAKAAPARLTPSPRLPCLLLNALARLDELWVLEVEVWKLELVAELRQGDRLRPSMLYVVASLADQMRAALFFIYFVFFKFLLFSNFALVRLHEHTCYNTRQQLRTSN
jgi:hypothetical protein